MGWTDYAKWAVPGYAAYRGGKALLGHDPFESQGAEDQRNQLTQQGQAASGFADTGQAGYNAMTGEAAASRDYLRRLASGEESVSAEQLRQGLQQNLAGQRSMAASAAPGNSAMAARTAATNMGRMGAGMSGQAALAGLQERQMAQKQLADMIMGQRGQDLQAALGSRQNAISGFGGITPEKSWFEKYAGPIAMGAGIAAKVA